MQKKSFNQIMRIIKDNLSVYDFAYGYIPKDLGLGEVKVVEKYGGEDQGSTWFRIQHFVDHDVYIKTDGHYSSYGGTEFYDGHGYEVLPTEVKVIQYLAAPIVPDAEEDRVLTGEELIVKLKANVKDYTFADEDEVLDESLFGENEVIEAVGNHEGAGEHAHTVRYFKKHDVYIKIEGFYSSYHGCDWSEDYIIVRPAKKTITVFE